ncbi:MAG: signal peptidase II [Pyrinomonadaceae bacterium]
MNSRAIYWKFAYIASAMAVLLMDQASKAWAVKTLKFGGDKSIIPGFLNFAYATNTGAAFSLFAGNGQAGRLGLSIVAISATAVVLYFFWRTPRDHDRLLGALALLLAGILGNVIDRLRMGFVVDFIDVQFGSWHYPTFNIADIAICCGVFLLVVDMLFQKKELAAETAA